MSDGKITPIDWRSLKPVELTDAFIMLLGERTQYSEYWKIDEIIIRSISKNDLEMYSELMILIESLISDQLNRPYFHYSGSVNGSIALTLTGWRRFDELKRGGAMQNQVFFAHQFGNPEICAALDRFAEVCDANGYRVVDLERLEDLKAGRINDRIELEIKLSRFVIADLTHNNNGAYWEAGFAAGLGRKVIYTCHKDFFNNTGKYKDDNHKGPKTHFDVNHHMTILWEPDDLDAAAEQLDACIKNTIIYPTGAIT